MGRLRRNHYDPKRVSLWTERAPDGHRHAAIFNDAGNGWTTTVGGHNHKVSGLELKPAADGHTHELSTERVELDELDEVPAAVA